MRAFAIKLRVQRDLELRQCLASHAGEDGVLRSEVIKPYIQELDRNVSSKGVPTMRPLAYEFPADTKCGGINDQYMLGPKYLVAPVTLQNATTRVVYFPAGAEWVDILGKDPTKVIAGGQTLMVDAPLDTIPVYSRK